MKMTKKQMIKEVRDVCTGRSGHTHIFVTPLFPCYEVETSISNDREGRMHFSHCCNEMSLREASEMIEEQSMNFN